MAQELKIDHVGTIHRKSTNHTLAIASDDCKEKAPKGNSWVFCPVGTCVRVQ